MGPALVNDPLSCSFIVQAFVGPTLVHDRPFLLSAGIAILVLVKAHETKTAWYSYLGSSPIGALLISSRCFSEDAILC